MQASMSEEVSEIETRSSSSSMTTVAEPTAKKARTEIESKGANKFAAHIEAK